MDPEERALQANGAMARLLPSAIPLRFNNRRTDSCPAGFRAGPLTHVPSFGLYTAPVKWVFLILILQGVSEGSVTGSRCHCY